MRRFCVEQMLLILDCLPCMVALAWITTTPEDWHTNDDLFSCILKPVFSVFQTRRLQENARGSTGDSTTTTTGSKWKQTPPSMPSGKKPTERNSADSEWKSKALEPGRPHPLCQGERSQQREAAPLSNEKAEPSNQATKASSLFLRRQWNGKNKITRNGVGFVLCLRTESICRLAELAPQRDTGSETMKTSSFCMERRCQLDVPGTVWRYTDTLDDLVCQSIALL